jgi:hypothetical protein
MHRRKPLQSRSRTGAESSCGPDLLLRRRTQIAMARSGRRSQAVPQLSRAIQALKLSVAVQRHDAVSDSDPARHPYPPKLSS